MIEILELIEDLMQIDDKFKNIIVNELNLAKIGDLSQITDDIQNNQDYSEFKIKLIFIFVELSKSILIIFFLI